LIYLSSSSILNIDYLCKGYVFSYYWILFYSNKIKRYAADDKEILSYFIGKREEYIGYATLAFALLSSFLVKKNWKFNALLTPFLILLGTVCFYIPDLLGNSSLNFLNFDMDILAITSIYAGLGSFTLMKASKYAIFGPNKEHAFMHLDNELKTKGKAAVDGVVSKFGKSLGGILVTCGIANIFCLISSLIAWGFTVFILDHKLKPLRKSIEKNKSKLESIEHKRKLS